MAIKSGQAVLNSEFTQQTITGFQFYQQGLLDSTTGTIKAKGYGRWNDATTWNQFTDWTLTKLPIKWTAPVLDIGSVKYFTVSVAAEFTGTSNYYEITVSDTGEFAGEETVYKILEGNTNVSAFYGRYVYVTFVMTGSELSRMTVTTDTTTQTIKFTNVDTSTLSGSASSRSLPITTPVSQVTSMDIRVIATTAYNMDVYVTDYPSSTALVPIVISKSGTTPTFKLVGLDNVPRNGLVDIEVSVLPRQAVISGNMVVIT